MRTQPPDVFSDPRWFEVFSNHVPKPEDQVRCYTVTPSLDHEGPVLTLPMWDRGKSTFLLPRTLRSLSNHYSSLYSPVLETGISEQAVDLAMAALVDFLAGEKPEWDVVRIEPLANDGFAYNSFKKYFRANRWLLQEYFCFVNWHLPIDEQGYDGYVARRPARLRNTINRRTRRFLEISGARIDVVNSGKEAVAGLIAFEKVYAASWKTPESHPAFITGLVHEANRQGWLRLGTAWLGDEPVAAQLWLVVNSVAYIFKLAHDPKFDKLSPGTVLTARMFQHVLDVDGVTEVDYLTGNESYKADWMTHRRERWGLLAFNPRTFNGVVQAGRHILGRWVKQLVLGVNRDG